MTPLGKSEGTEGAVHENKKAQDQLAFDLTKNCRDQRMKLSPNGVRMLQLYP